MPPSYNVVKRDAKGTAGERVRYSYRCAQIECRQKAPKKVDNPEKQRDKVQMASFDCHGWLMMTINTETPNIISLHLQHKCDHVPYCDVALPEDVRARVMKEVKDKTVTQVGVIELTSTEA